MRSSTATNFSAFFSSRRRCLSTAAGLGMCHWRGPTFITYSMIHTVGMNSSRTSGIDVGYISDSTPAAPIEPMDVSPSRPSFVRRPCW